MSKIIDIKDRLKDKSVEELVILGEQYDSVTLKFLEEGIDIVNVAGIMANRLGEIVRVFDGDREALEVMVYSIINDRINLVEEDYD